VSNPLQQTTTSTQMVNLSLTAIQVTALVVLSFAVTRRSTCSLRGQSSLLRKGYGKGR
jgi:hypothetical protein